MNKEKLDVKLGSEEMKLWNTVIKQCKAEIKQLQDSLIVQGAFLKKAEEMLKIEENNFNSL